jgi:FMN reductase (NADPH)
MCYIGAIRNHPGEVIQLLELPPLVFPVSGMTLGWPDAEPFIRPRLPLRAVLHWERYDTRGEESALSEYDREMIATGIYKGRQVPVPGAEGEIEDYGWQEHSARRASTPMRTGLRKVIEEQGFQLK